MKKTLLKSLALAAVSTLCMVGNAMATTFSPTISDMLTWMYDLSKSQGTLLTSAFPVTPYVIGTNVVGAEFDGIFSNTLADPAYATFGKTTVSDLSVYTNYDLLFLNHNESPWEYKLFLADSDGTFYAAPSPEATIPNGSSSILSMDLIVAASAGIDLSHVTFYGIQIGFDVPRISTGNNGQDYTFETAVSPVPEPATMLLFGTGLIGLAGASRRRKYKK